MCGTYEVVLGPAAERMMRGMESQDQKRLAEVLRTELADGPNARSELTFDGSAHFWLSPHSADGQTYTATPLSFNAYTAVHRPLAARDLQRLERERARPAADAGFYVVDILPAEAAFSRRPRLR